MIKNIASIIKCLKPVILSSIGLSITVSIVIHGWNFLLIKIRHEFHYKFNDFRPLYVKKHQTSEYFFLIDYSFFIIDLCSSSLLFVLNFIFVIFGKMYFLANVSLIMSLILLMPINYLINECKKDYRNNRLNCLLCHEIDVNGKNYYVLNNKIINSHILVYPLKVYNVDKIHEGILDNIKSLNIHNEDITDIGWKYVRVTGNKHIKWVSKISNFIYKKSFKHHINLTRKIILFVVIGIILNIIMISLTLY